MSAVRVGWVLVALAISCWLLSAVSLLIPTSVHADTDYGRDIFFGCGTALTSTAEPYEEPGIAKCDAVNRKHRTAAVGAALAGLVIGAPGAYVIARQRPRP